MNKQEQLKQLSTLIEKWVAVAKEAGAGTIPKTLATQFKILKPVHQQSKAALKNITAQEEEPFPDLETFLVAIKPFLFKKVALKLKDRRLKIIPERGNITEAVALMQFLEINSLKKENDWQISLWANPKVQDYLEQLYTKHQSKLTDFSVERYAHAASNAIWQAYVVNGSVEPDPNEVGTTDEVLTNDQLIVIFKHEIKNKKLLPKSLLQKIEAYEETMQGKQAAGYSRFLTDWRYICRHLKSFVDKKNATHENYTPKQYKSYIKQMYKNLAILLDQEEYFAWADLIGMEEMNIGANPENHNLSSQTRRSNRKAPREKTKRTFGAAYKKEQQPPVGDPIDKFNTADVPFMRAPIVPNEGMTAKERSKWLEENVLNDETPIGGTGPYMDALSEMATALRSNPKLSIEIIGKSNYGIELDRKIAERIGEARAKTIKKILTDKYKVKSRQIKTKGIVIGASEDIGIEIKEIK